MRNLVIFIFLVILTSLSKSGIEPTLRWGLVGIKNDFVVDETEITVAEWLEFVCYHQLNKYPNYARNSNCKLENLNEIERKNLLRFDNSKSLLPDSAIITNLPCSFLFLEKSNLTLIDYRHGLKGVICLPVNLTELEEAKKKYGFKSINDFMLAPVVGISFSQAVEFCRWRNQVDKKRYSYLVENHLFDERFHEFYTFSLPKQSEFQLLNSKMDSISKKGEPNFNYLESKHLIELSRDTSTAFGSSNVFDTRFVIKTNDDFGRFFINLKHIQGNVCEMTSTEGESMGGSFYHYAKYSYDSIITYTKPTKWLGFRCVGRKMKG